MAAVERQQRYEVQNQQRHVDRGQQADQVRHPVHDGDGVHPTTTTTARFSHRIRLAFIRITNTPTLTSPGRATAHTSAKCMMLGFACRSLVWKGKSMRHNYRIMPFGPETSQEMQRRLRERATWMPYNWFGYSHTTMPIFGPQAISLELGDITPDGGRLMIVDAAGDLAGQVSWFPGYAYGGSPRHRGWGIGLTVLPEHRRTSAAQSALIQLIDYLFSTTTVNRIESVSAASAVPKRLEARPAGMTREGVIRQAQWRDGSWHDVAMYSILRSEWLSQNVKQQQ